MLWNELTIEISPENIGDAIAFFNDIGILTLNIIDPNDIDSNRDCLRWDYIDEEIINRDMSKAFVKAYIDDDIKSEEIMLKAKNKGFNISKTVLKAEDWENGWKKYYKPFNICGDIVIVPAWEEYEKKENEKIITLDSGMAFGNGTHETTKMCAYFIEKYIKSGTKVLDIGTGSGILSICAGVFGARDITGIDIDELSIKIAKENIKLNNMENIINIKQGDLFKEVTGEFDIIIANIVADVIKELIPDIPTYLKSNGFFIASGIISEREKEVIDFATENNFSVFDLQGEGDWSAVVFTLKG